MRMLLPLGELIPHEDNIRRFYDEETLVELVNLFTEYRESGYSGEIKIPDIDVRPIGPGKYQVLSGHRRVQAAALAGCACVFCRVFELTDEEAYEYVASANHYAALTPVELAVRAAEMHELGFGQEEIEREIGAMTGKKQISLYRYLAVGQLVPKEKFVDGPKADVSILLWYEAACYGAAHFARCFQHWNTGAWDEEECEREFRRRDQVLPRDNQEKGLRLTISPDGETLKIRGTLQVGLHSKTELVHIFDEFQRDAWEVIARGVAAYDTTGFGDGSGKKWVRNYNPETLE